MSFNIKFILQDLFALQRLGIKVGLEHTEELLNAIGNPHTNLNCIHIAGTNGKGSTCAIINRILIESGLTVGLYTSPHLVNFNERIQVNNQEISDYDIAQFINENRNYIKKINTTFFETTTAMAFDYFHKKSVDIAIIETGLGGRLDSTNVISPTVCGITSISLDHSDILGNTIEKISQEKAGIIKKNIPVYIFEQNESIIDIIKTKSAKENAPLSIIKNNVIDISITNVSGSVFKYKDFNIKLPLIGSHQIQNCVLAVDIAEFVLKRLNTKLINRAISKLSWAGRMEKLSEENIYYDVAHNYDGIKALINTVEKIHPDSKIVGLFCIKAEKNIKIICELIKKYFTKIIICQDKEKYLLSVKDLSQIFKKEKINFSEAKSVKAGIKTLTNENMGDYVRLIFGSHYIAKEVYSEF
tara:strand:+ start:2238 stop:3479 length:1242 start_codon:yes stop_codon:yes gene_type:complete